MRFTKLIGLLPHRRRFPEYNEIEPMPIEELMRRQGVSGVQGPEFWKQCPWAGDDEVSTAIRRAIELHSE